MELRGSGQRGWDQTVSDWQDQNGSDRIRMDGRRSERQERTGSDKSGAVRSGLEGKRTAGKE